LSAFPSNRPIEVDYLALIDLYLPGVVATRLLVGELAHAHDSGTAMTRENVRAINGPLPVEDQGLPRFADSNPAPMDGWTTYGRLD
jgi:hypothetical protein